MPCAREWRLAKEQHERTKGISTHPLAATGGGIDLHYAGGRGAIRQTGAAVFRWQRLHCDGALAQKAFWPAKLPFPLVHVDTGHNFDETIQFRDDLANDVGGDLVVASVQEEIDAGRAKEETGPNPSRNRLQIPALLNAIEKNQYDACLAVPGVMRKRRGQGAVLFPPKFLRRVGSEKSAPGALEPVQR